jgi:hypothetical protein
VVRGYNGSFVINFIGNIKRYQLLKKKWATLLLHLSWILSSQAFVTRYISYEGMMPIREVLLRISFIQIKHFDRFVDGEYKGEMKRRVF